MTAERVLAHLCRCDAVVSVNGSRLRVEAPQGVLTPLLRETLAARKADLLRLLGFVEEYRVLLRSDTEAVSAKVQAWLIDELGPVLATAVRQAVEREAVPPLRAMTSNPRRT